MDDTAIADVASEGEQTLTVDNLSRGSHIHIACRSVYDRDQEPWLVKIVLDRLIAPFRGS